MQKRQHPLRGSHAGCQRFLTSWHFGQADGGPRCYLQAGLHAEELPGQLVLHRLRQKLEQLEQQGLLRGEIVIVPQANPIGLSQFQFGLLQGRFDNGTGRNFNRGFPLLAHDLPASADQRLSGTEVRQALVSALEQRPADTELASLQHLLFGLALQADVVLDLHCDSEAALHLYSNTSLSNEAEVLAGFLGAAATLVCREAGGMSFDDAILQNWLALQPRLASGTPLPFAATVELRGVSDVAHELAEQDAEQLLAYLGWRGAIRCQSKPVPPAAPNRPTPLEGVEVLTAPHAGLVVYRHPVGSWIAADTPLVDIVDPISGASHTLHNRSAGIYYARVQQRYAAHGAELCFIAGASPLRHGALLSA